MVTRPWGALRGLRDDMKEKSETGKGASLQQIGAGWDDAAPT
jgi:hypothetical protein